MTLDRSPEMGQMDVVAIITSSDVSIDN